MSRNRVCHCLCPNISRIVEFVFVPAHIRFVCVNVKISLNIKNITQYYIVQLKASSVFLTQSLLLEYLLFFFLHLLSLCFLFVINNKGEKCGATDCRVKKSFFYFYRSPTTQLPDNATYISLANQIFPLVSEPSHTQVPMLNLANNQYCGAKNSCKRFIKLCCTILMVNSLIEIASLPVQKYSEVV